MTRNYEKKMPQTSEKPILQGGDNEIPEVLHTKDGYSLTIETWVGVRLGPLEGEDAAKEDAKNRQKEKTEQRTGRRSHESLSDIRHVNNNSFDSVSTAFDLKSKRWVTTSAKTSEIRPERTLATSLGILYR